MDYSNCFNISSTVFSGRTIVALWPSWISGPPRPLALLALWLLELSPFGFFFASGPCALLRDFVPRFGPLCLVLRFGLLCLYLRPSGLCAVCSLECLRFDLGYDVFA
jgi:hypothetical protein